MKSSSLLKTQLSAMPFLAYFGWDQTKNCSQDPKRLEHWSEKLPGRLEDWSETRPGRLLFQEDWSEMLSGRLVWHASGPGRLVLNASRKDFFRSSLAGHAVTPRRVNHQLWKNNTHLPLVLLINYICRSVSVTTCPLIDSGKATSMWSWMK